ncbi:YbaL family putative K(+) efflux transporter [Roseomonas sp. E05]|uniref:YbaL family putative K(+) efflux transporter n=1 Tax=Roseomonas sp. E05 TaxID=3046310 RepID=UPI0024BACDD2|nr:YbaL family putative K(+) efflux transporter [Roseomonas sp. E05]MDJ0391409.1 YbaL family putative K(+) efflux transporter [Roseomonas sp. E05]
MHNGPLLATICAGLTLAFILGALAQRLRISPLVGYLLAGVAIGPFTPGFVADQDLANELAEVGVILLMFGVGLHFSLKDLLAVRRIALPGAVAQIGVATLMGMGLSYLLGWSWGAGFVFGLALSVASTVVLLRALQERRLVETERGRIAVGWLIVEDLAMVLALVLLPALAGAMGGGPAMPDAHGAATASQFGLAGILLLTLGKVAAFMAMMLLVGRRLIPAVLHWVVHTGSRELFRLSVLAVALGVAYGAALLFDVSFALGAFFAGMVLAESPLSHRAAEETLPLRDAFAVLFFVSVGMLFNPNVVVAAPLALLGTVIIILVGKSIAAYVIVRAFGRSHSVALTISASLAQIGEFSFILAGLGVALGVLPEEGRDLILAGAILSIFCNPFAFILIDRLVGRPAPAQAPAPVPAPPPAAREDEEATDLRPTSLTGHAVLVGYGRVGSLVGQGLRKAGQPVLVIEERREGVEAARADGLEALLGNAADPEVLAAANLAAAERLFVAIPESFHAGQVVEQARATNPGIEILARAHTEAEVEHLMQLGATLTVMGEREIARGMLAHARQAGG